VSKDTTIQYLLVMIDDILTVSCWILWFNHWMFLFALLDVIFLYYLIN
jgi:hypothetical protein